MKIIFLPYEHETIPMTSFAKSLRKKINHKQFFFISDFFSQISSNRYTNKIIKEHSYDDTQILDIYDEIKEISKIKENSKLINVDYNYLKNIESEFIDNTINQLIYKDCHFLDLYHPRDYYFVPKSKELKLKFVELIIKKIVKFLDQVSPEIVFSFGNNHLKRNIFFQLSKKYNYKFLNLAHTRFLNRYYFCENNKSTLTNNILTRANYLMKNKDEINFELVKKFINKIVDRIENNEGSYDVSNVYNSNEISLSFLKK